ncbi:uncharacterized protein PGTG_06295 [Puccinia graminis f. sp. tritici CRL 75-36-700-3]|uniref:Uncharacterized protein n=1 Tax=Puccinia graminis f. sp. tritici (strain CRL 75-36-700-3 / race SCCL) TaxID=418459 RepID=E3K7P1_PUCGT|nr:uncharacterized protein PGTG_06295 [Puccinia graminis f. sp. tritici CRL 75-36-700-3]EFP80339.2 hypothetical protein PGTG_06295 [Puccinia graminis f. sp. tritici CRL 75-36-700-3]
MVRTVPNTISRRTITQQQQPQYSPSPACTDPLLNRNNLNRFFDRSLNTYPHPSPSNPTPSIEDPITTQNSSIKPIAKSHFLGVLIPKHNPPSIKEPSTGLRRRQKTLISSVHRFSKNHHQHNQPMKKKKKTPKYNNRQRRKTRPDIGDEEGPEQDLEVERYWLALIKEIKTRRSFEDEDRLETDPRTAVFLKVEWFYRLDDFENSMKNNPVFRKIVGKLKKIGFRSNQNKLRSNDFRFQDKELIRTDHSTIIHINSLAGKADIYKFDDQVSPQNNQCPIFERCCWQTLEKKAINHSRIDDNHMLQSIGVDRFYYRLHLRLNHPPRRTLSRKNSGQQSNGLFEFINLTPNDQFGCKCTKVYDPRSEMMIYDFEGSEWVHLSCLITHLTDHQHEDSTTTRDLVHHAINDLQVRLESMKMKTHAQCDMLQIKAALLQILIPSSATTVGTHLSFGSRFFNNRSLCLLRGFLYSLAGQFC